LSSADNAAQKPGSVPHGFVAMIEGIFDCGDDKRWVLVGTRHNDSILVERAEIKTHDVALSNPKLCSKKLSKDNCSYLKSC
jgi:hypothetical protein